MFADRTITRHAAGSFDVFAFNDNELEADLPTLPELLYLRRGLAQAGGKLPLFDLDGQAVAADHRPPLPRPRLGRAVVQQSAEAGLAGLQAHRSRPQARNALIYLVRHGETVWNQAGRQQGQLDSPLTPKGVEQARAAGRMLQRILPDELDVVLETSPLGRAGQPPSSLPSN